MYKLEPEDFKSEEDIQKLIRYLEESPLNRQALPDARNKIGSYYRRLQRRSGETVPAFLIREDKVHDEMMKALQRLLREKELDFEGYDMSLSELKNFCGIPEDQSMYFGDFEGQETEEETSSQRTATPSREGVPLSSRPGVSSTSSTQDTPVKPRGRDLIDRLMQKGLIPLAALDVVRGWMLLEMSTASDDDRRLVRAATRNKLGYTDIKQALLSMYEEKAHRIPMNQKGHKGYGRYGGIYNVDTVNDWETDPEVASPNQADNFSAVDYGEWQQWQDAAWFADSWMDDWGDTQWYGEQGDGWSNDAWSEEPSPNHAESSPDNSEMLNHLMKEQEAVERQHHELQALVQENERNMMEARRAVQQAAQDRGWNQPPQQRQPKFTSTYPMKGKKGYAAGSPMPSKGKINFNDKGKGKSKYGKGKGFGKMYKGNMNKGKDVHFADQFYHTIWAVDEQVSELSPSEAVVDTGATATAGGRWAVQQLCTAVMNNSPDTSMRVYMDERPWFRFGNGRWGQALFKVVLQHQNLSMTIYSLPSPGVPVLLGMRELDTLDAILGTKTGRCIINGKQTILRRTSKKHLVLDFLKDVFPADSNMTNDKLKNDIKTDADRTARQAPLRQRIYVAASEQSEAEPNTKETHYNEVHDLWMFAGTLDVHAPDDSTVFACEQLTKHISSGDEHSLQQHFDISEGDLEFLLNRSQQHSYQEKKVRFVDQSDERRAQEADERNDERSDARAIGRKPIKSGLSKAQDKVECKVQEPNQLRRDKELWSRQERSKDFDNNMALHGRACEHQDFKQSLREVERMREVRPSYVLHPSSHSTIGVHQVRESQQCHGSIAQTSHRGMDSRRGALQDGQVGHFDCGQGEDHKEGEQDSWGSEGQAKDITSTEEGCISRVVSGDRQRARGFRRVFPEGGQDPEEGAIALQEGHDHVHHDEDEAGQDARERPLEGVEKMWLAEAAKEFNCGAILASMQDCCGPPMIWEVCCRLESTLANECQRLGIAAIRKTIENGYDVEKGQTVVRLLDEARREKPKRTWWSLKCTPWTNIQNINQRTEEQVEALRKKRQKGRKGVKNSLEAIKQMVIEDPEMRFYWEWPKTAYAGWRLPEMRSFEKAMKEAGVRLFWTEIHGCMMGVKAPSGELLKKEWYIMTNDSDFHWHCQVLCDQSHVHREGGIVGIGSTAVESTGYYPERMVNMIAKRWKSQFEQERRQHYNVNVKEIIHAMDDVSESQRDEKEEQTMDDISQKEKDKAEVLLHKLHKAAGHPTNRALARLCKDRGMPEWMITMAKQLKCQACLDTARGEQLVIPYSLGAKPGPWQIVSLDTMELVFPGQRCKARFLIGTCMVMKFVAATMVWKGPVGEAGIDGGRHLAKAFVEMWLHHRPRPQWLLVDPQTSLAAGQFVEFMQMAGIGVSVSPGEDHWQQGTIESLIRVIKGTMRRIRNDHPELEPSTCCTLAVCAHNHQYKSQGYSPIQWAYGYDPEAMTPEVDPMEYNSHQPPVAPYNFWQTQKLRSEAEETWRHEQSKEAWSRLNNAAPRKPREYHVGEWVCVWRTAIWRTRRTSKNTNPEPRFVGPGRVALIEPAIIAENKPAIYWVLMGTQVWRCAPEQLRKASEYEITIEELQKGARFSTPIGDLLRRTTKVVEVHKEPGYERDSSSLPTRPAKRPAEPVPEDLGRSQPSGDWEEDLEESEDRWRQRSKRARDFTVKEQSWRWKQMVSVNENRRREGLPPIMELPPLPMSEEDDFNIEAPQVFAMDGENDLPFAEEDKEQILWKIEQLEQLVKGCDEKERMREEIKRSRIEEKQLVEYVLQACEKGEEICEIILEVDDHRHLLEGGSIYAKQMMSSAKEINFRNLSQEDRSLVEEAMARELSEVLRSKALRVIQEKLPEETLQQRCIPMRWLLTWKPLDEYQDPKKEQQPGVTKGDGRSKAKARIVLIGYKHPDLAKRDPRTGKPLLQTSSPTLSRMGRNTFLQATSLSGHTLECADAKSAFLQADHGIGTTKLYTRAVPEISKAFNVPTGTALEVVGAIYGLTNAPRVFWLDADEKIHRLGATAHGIDKCVWTFADSTGHVFGRIAAHVDDFHIAGDMSNPDWVATRERIKTMYSWSPWKRGSFVFAGVHIQQLQDFTILIDQEQFCHDLTPVTIDGDRNRAKDDKMTQAELSQCRGLLMKAQWRAIQTAPQYCCRIGLAASSIVKGTVDVLREANSIIKELKKSSQDNLIFHSFANEQLDWNQVVFIHFSDAGRGNRLDGGDTGGYISCVSSPQILTGREALTSIIDYKSWKLDRPVRGSNGSEAQALYIAEDAGWKLRVFWALLFGHHLARGNADDLSATVESLLVMDSRGCYDALSNSDSPLLGMNNAKTGVELMSVQRGLKAGSNCFPAWTPSDMNLSDFMTKVAPEAFKLWALWQSRRTWIVRFNEEFVSARKQQKLRKQQGKAKHVLLEDDLQEEGENIDVWNTIRR